MESPTVLETRKQIQPETIEETESKRTMLEQFSQPRFEHRHYKRYHRCQRWTRTSFHR